MSLVVRRWPFVLCLIAGILSPFQGYVISRFSHGLRRGLHFSPLCGCHENADFGIPISTNLSSKRVG